MAKYIARINDTAKSPQGAVRNSKTITVPKVSSLIVAQKKGLRKLVMMMADGDAVAYKELFKFAVSDFLTKADQFTMIAQQRMEHARKNKQR